MSGDHVSGEPEASPPLVARSRGFADRVLRLLGLPRGAVVPELRPGPGLDRHVVVGVQRHAGVPVALRLGVLQPRRAVDLARCRRCACRPCPAGRRCPSPSPPPSRRRRRIAPWPRRRRRRTRCSGRPSRSAGRAGTGSAPGRSRLMTVLCSIRRSTTFRTSSYPGLMHSTIIAQSPSSGLGGPGSGSWRITLFRNVTWYVPSRTLKNRSSSRLSWTTPHSHLILPPGRVLGLVLLVGADPQGAAVDVVVGHREPRRHPQLDAPLELARPATGRCTRSAPG